MNLSPLHAISPIDGRYHNQTAPLADYFSEYALIRYRVLVEAEYLIALAEQGIQPLAGHLTAEKYASVRDIYINFSQPDAHDIKATESITNHDVKAVEYFVKKQIERREFAAITEFVHFGLTSQDINNTAIPLSLKEAFENVIWPDLNQLLSKIETMAAEWAEFTMLAHTHGQPASPTTVGKEFKVFAVRLKSQMAELKRIPFAAKFGGATGNMNAHCAAYPNVDWKKFAADFVENKLGLHHSFPTTQIEHYDYLAATCDAMRRINTVLIDLARDTWAYISMNYLKQRVNKEETGSSAMPHKVNPIDFENAEGNLGIANALLHHLSEKLPVSRLQRDLTDSTVLRNLGVPFAHSLLAIKNLLKGLNKISLNEEQLNADLEANWAVVTEAIQTILRREGYPQPYEKLKELSRGNVGINREAIHAFIDMLDISSDVNAELKSITPFNYTGLKG